MFKYTILFAAIAGLVFALSPAADAGVVIPSAGITATAGSTWSSYDPMNVIDGTALTGVYPDETHAVYTSAWLSGTYNTPYDWFRVDLGSPYLLETMRVWNAEGPEGDRGVNQVDIYYSTDDTAPGDDFTDAKWTLLGTAGTQTFSNGPHPDPTPVTDVIPMNVTARVIGLDINSAWGDAYSPALRELQFIEVPEPATMALLAFGGLGVLLRRRRR